MTIYNYFSKTLNSLKTIDIISKPIIHRLHFGQNNATKTVWGGFLSLLTFLILFYLSYFRAELIYLKKQFYINSHESKLDFKGKVSIKEQSFPILLIMEKISLDDWDSEVEWDKSKLQILLKDYYRDEPLTLAPY